MSLWGLLSLLTTCMLVDIEYDDRTTFRESFYERKFKCIQIWQSTSKGQDKRNPLIISMKNKLWRSQDQRGSKIIKFGKRQKKFCLWSHRFLSLKIVWRFVQRGQESEGCWDFDWARDFTWQTYLCLILSVCFLSLSPCLYVFVFVVVCVSSHMPRFSCARAYDDHLLLNIR